MDLLLYYVEYFAYKVAVRFVYILDRISDPDLKRKKDVMAKRIQETEPEQGSKFRKLESKPVQLLEFKTKELLLSHLIQDGNISEISYLIRREYFKKSELSRGLVEACYEGETEIVRELLRAGADDKCIVSKHDPDSMYKALSEACHSGKTSVVEYLISIGTDVNCDYGTPLRRASEMGHLSIVKILIDAGAKVTDSDLEKLYIMDIKLPRHS